MSSLQKGPAMTLADYSTVAMPIKKRQQLPPRSTYDKLLKVIMNLLVPPMVFCLVSSILGFSFQVRYPLGVWFAVSVALIPIWLSYRSVCHQAKLGLSVGWSRLSLILFSVALVFGIFLGQRTFYKFTQPATFYDSLRNYKDVDPSGISGTRLMDAGKVEFVAGTRVALDLAMSYTNFDVYCVAPIALGEALPTDGRALVNYDLWAVGVNCCSPGSTDFHCGSYNDPSVRSAIRVAEEHHRLAYQLAVQQAQGAYGITSKHPLFFEWVKNPEDSQNKLYMATFSHWVKSQILHFGVNVFFLIMFMWIFQPKDHTSLDVLRA